MIFIDADITYDTLLTGNMQTYIKVKVKDINLDCLQCYKKRVVVQNKSNLLLKIFCETIKHYNYLIKVLMKLSVLN